MERRIENEDRQQKEAYEIDAAALSSRIAHQAVGQEKCWDQKITPLYAFDDARRVSIRQQNRREYQGEGQQCTKHQQHSCWQLLLVVLKRHGQRPNG